MAENGREEFIKGIAIAIKEWKEAGILPDDGETPFSPIARIDIEDRRFRLQLHELRETQISLSVVQRLKNLVQMDGLGKRTNGSIGIDLLSADWLKSGMEPYNYQLTIIYALCQP